MADVRIKYALPTARTDGRALPVSQISHVSVAMSADGGENFTVIDQVPATETEVLIRELEPGTYHFELVVVDTDAKLSAPAAAQATIETAAPNGVSAVVVTVE